MNDTPKLCYITRNWAFFTTQALSKQWGDDWNDAPYEHNAGDPYTYSEYDKEKGRAAWEIIRVAYRSNMETPAEIAWGGNSHYSVEQINRGDVAWLRDTYGGGQPIYAGVTIEEFKRAIWANGGEVYERSERPQATLEPDKLSASDTD